MLGLIISISSFSFANKFFRFRTPEMYFAIALNIQNTEWIEVDYCVDTVNASETL